MANVITEDLIVFKKASIGDSERLTSGSLNGNLEIVDKDSLNPGGVRINLVSGTADAIRKGVINFGESDADILGNPQGSIEFDHNTDTFNFRINGSSIPQFTFDQSGATFLNDLTVLGTTITVNSATLAITDNLITVNKDEVGAGVTLGLAGIEVERGISDNTTWQFQESDSGWGPAGPAGFSIIARVSVMDTTAVGNSLEIQGNGSLRVPVGNDAQQPANQTGLIRFNTDDVAFELNDGTSWDSLSFASGSGVFVSRTGDLMTGSLEMATGQILGDNGGTVGAPSYAFSTDTDTGMLRSNPNQISFATGGVERLRLDSAGVFSVRNSGRFFLTQDPISVLEAATKQYVDNEITGSGGSFVSKGGDTMTGVLTMSGVSIQPLSNNTSGVGVPGNVFSSMHATTFFGTATAALYADLAERYAADMLLDVGTVVVFGGEAEITECVTHANTAVAGVISGKPGIMMNHEAGPDSTHPYVALKGKVPCKVVGPVKKGDLMITSMIRGHGKSAGKKAEPYTAFARALEDRDVGLTEQGIIMVSII